MNKRKATSQISEDESPLKILCIVSIEINREDGNIPLYTRDELITKRYRFNIALRLKNSMFLFTRSSIYSKLIPFSKIKFKDNKLMIFNISKDICIIESFIEIISTNEAMNCMQILMSISPNNLVIIYSMMKNNHITSFHINMIHDMILSSYIKLLEKMK